MALHVLIAIASCRLPQDTKGLLSQLSWYHGGDVELLMTTLPLLVSGSLFLTNGGPAVSGHPPKL